jgi:hypothetical protein
MTLPAWHPLLRTAALLRGGPQLAADLIFLADGLSENPMVASPREVVELVAADLWQLRSELEIFDEKPRRNRWEAFRGARRLLGGLAVEMGYRTRGEESLDPLRALAALRLDDGARATVGRVGVQLAIYFEEYAPEPRLADPVNASAIGAYCDIAHLATVLRQQEERTDGPFQGQLATWARALEREAGVLRLVVPSLEEEDPEITRTEIPVPREGEGCDG